MNLKERVETDLKSYKRPKVIKLKGSHPWLCFWDVGYGHRCAFSTWQQAICHALELYQAYH